MSSTGLRDTGAVQSLLSRDRVTSDFYRETEEFRFIKGISSEIIEIPLAQIDLSISDRDLTVKGLSQ